MKTFTKILFFITFIINHSALTFAQNLVPNPSFEEHDVCPSQYNQICLAKSWFSFSTGGQEYFNSCDTTNCFSVPYNINGYQHAYEGQGYIGLYFNNPLSINQRESVGCKLVDSLRIGEKYYISFFVSLADFSQFACNNIGLLFTTYSDSTQPCSSISLSQIRNYAHINYNQVITDTANWIKISGSFVADSSYQYLIISNFFDDNNTVEDTINYGVNTGAYYYIDCVYVSEDSSDNIYEIHNKNNFIVIYPNPTYDYLNINCNDSKIELIYCRLYDIYGRLLKEYKKIKTPEKLNITLFPSGIYLLQVKTKYTIFNKKIIINH